MSTPRQILRRFMEPLTTGQRRRVGPMFEGILQQLEHPVLPTAKETAAVTYGSVKVAALFFDRVHALITDALPPGIGFHGNSDFECAHVFSLGMMTAIRREASADKKLEETMDAVVHALEEISRKLPPQEKKPLARILAESFSNHHGIQVASLYDSPRAYDEEYRAGDRAAVVATIDGVLAVNDERLSWEQVHEMRRDPKSRLKLRRLLHWLDTEMVGKSRTYIEDEIALRVDDYETALKTHGIESVLGSVSTTLDSKVLMSGAATVAALSHVGEPTVAIFAGGSIVMGRVAVHIASRLLDFRAVRTATRPEVAFVVELQKRAKQAT